MKGRRKHGEIGGKWCLNCFRWKPVSEFYRKRDSYQSRCQNCNAEVVAGWKERSPKVYRAIYNRNKAKRLAAVA